MQESWRQTKLLCFWGKARPTRRLGPRLASMPLPLCLDVAAVGEAILGADPGSASKYRSPPRLGRCEL
jgi:hypothetical protein